MVFSTPIFLFLFLPLLVIIYFSSPKRLKNFILLAFSLFFYAWGEGSFLLLMVTSIVLNYFIGIQISKKPSNTIILTIGIAINLGLLIYFKYFMFIANEIRGDSFYSIYLPVGISFYTFQSISYLIDVYRTPQLANKKIDELALYISFFPQLIAGPILKYNSVADQLRNRKSTIPKIYLGASRFIFGLGKKVIIANTLGEISDEIFSISPNLLTYDLAWFGAVCFTFQIFFDFSGYSDMAIGLGKIFGFEFPENFNFPYLSKSIQEFWRRWHITLSSWFKDYVYIPLGGNRNGELYTYRNLIIIFLLCGIWHGANWTYLVWGLIHGLFLVLERKNFLNHLPKFAKHIYTLFIVIIAWVFFNSPTLQHASNYILAMFGLNDADGVKHYTTFYLSAELIVILVAGIIFSITSFKTTTLQNYPIVNGVCLLSILTLSILYLSGDSYNPFLYYKF